MMDMEIDDESEYEEEEYLVYIDIEPTALAESQIRQAKNLRIYGLEEKKPLLQINNTFFEGEFDISMGTHLFFERDEEAYTDELYCKCGVYYRFDSKTNKVLKMSRVLIKDKSTDSDVQEKDITGIRGQLQVQKTYEQALNLFLTPGREQPRKIPEDQNCEHLLCRPHDESALESLSNEEKIENDNATDSIADL